MKRSSLFTLLLLAPALTSLRAQVWQFDVDAADAPVAETQPGYTRLTTAAMTGNSTNGSFTLSATDNGVTITASVSGGFRDRGTGSGLTNQTLAPLLRDFIFDDASGGSIEVSLNNLPAGVYDLRSFHFDNSNQGALTDNAFDLQVTDAAGSQTYSSLVWSLTGNNYRARSDGSNSIQISIRENGVGNRVRFNGLRIVRYYAFDVDAFEAPPTETQAGFQRMTTPGMTGDSINGAFSPTGTLSTVTAMASAGGGFRDRGSAGSLAGQPLAVLLRDFIFEDGAGATIDVSIVGLSAGSYDLRSFHFDTLSSTDNAFELQVEDADGSRTITGQAWSVNGSRYSVRSDGAAPVLITVRETNGANRARFNGLEIGGGESLTTIPVPPAQAGDSVAANLMLINDNGGWSWYQDQKVIYDPVAGSVIASSAANFLGYGGEPRDSDIDAVTFHLASGQRTRRIMGKRDSQGDDHNMGSLWIRPDGRYLHMYTGHNDATRNSFYHFTTNAHDGASWGPQLFYNWSVIGNPDSSGNITYNNLHFMTAEGSGQGRLYNIGRESQRSPNIAYSDDLGQSWTYAGKLSLTRTASSYSNGYLKFIGNGLNRIDFVTTEHHPRDYNTSIYHGYIQGGKSYNSFGTVIDTNIFDEIAPAPEDFTPVFLASPEDGINDHLEYHRAWTTELERDPQGNLYALFTTRFGTNIASNRSGDADHRLFYARFNGQWRVTELSRMGGPLYPPEQDYTGLGAIHPNNPNLVYISTTFDPRNNLALAKHEIFKGVTLDQGTNWQWTPITANSRVDNLRPAIPAWDADNTFVCWLRGDYVTQRDYDQSVVAIVDRRHETAGLVQYIDATSTNTTLADGSPLAATGPSTNQGAADNLWHWQTRFGNGGSVLAANESGAENAPTLKTSITGLSDGVYDVFAFFWSRPGEDWRVTAGFATSELLVFRRYSCQQAETNQCVEPVAVIDQDVALYRAYVGRRTVLRGAALEVFINDFDGGAGVGLQRTAYDGVGVARVLPVLSGSALKIERITRTGNLVTIRMPGYAGYKYQLQRADSLSLLNWQDIGARIDGAGTGGEGVPIEWIDGAGLSGGFYRVKVQLGP